MIKKFSVTNFKNFKDTVTLDFSKVRDYQFNQNCIKNKLINKMIIYGKNSVGKTNFGYAIMDVVDNVKPFINLPVDSSYTNANSNDDEFAKFEYTFCFGDDIVDYSYQKKSEYELISEQLTINKNEIFSFDFLNNYKMIGNIDYIHATTLNWEQFNQLNIDNQTIDSDKTSLPSVLRYIINNTIQPNDSIIRRLSQFISAMRFSRGNMEVFRYPRKQFFEYLNQEDNLLHLEKFFNKFDIECKLKLIRQPDGNDELYFDYNKPLLFSSNLSSGTKSLLHFYLYFFRKERKPSFIYLDEFDAFYHFELSEGIVDYLENEFDCQVILTSHNTSLLSNSIMRPDCYHILTPSRITPICDATTRELRQGHNLEKLLKNGEFDEDGN